MDFGFAPLFIGCFDRRHRLANVRPEQWEAKL
jgi:hypothetical protein